MTCQHSRQTLKFLNFAKFSQFPYISYLDCRLFYLRTGFTCRLTLFYHWIVLLPTIHLYIFFRKIGRSRLMKALGWSWEKRKSWSNPKTTCNTSRRFVMSALFSYRMGILRTTSFQRLYNVLNRLPERIQESLTRARTKYQDLRLFPIGVKGAKK